MNTTQASRNDRLATSPIALPARAASMVKQTAETVNSTHPTTVSFHDERGPIGASVGGPGRAALIRPRPSRQFIAASSLERVGRPTRGVLPMSRGDLGRDDRSMESLAVHVATLVDHIASRP